ncbi:MAG: hypothetical protein JWM11_5403 [Planctomycetaceae bacterium]|nr:hypothetical protein [Planctomycetaceae bacterium]
MRPLHYTGEHGISVGRSPLKPTTEKRDPNARRYGSRQPSGLEFSYFWGFPSSRLLSCRVRCLTWLSHVEGVGHSSVLASDAMRLQTLVRRSSSTTTLHGVLMPDRLFLPDPLPVRARSPQHGSTRASFPLPPGVLRSTRPIPHPPGSVSLSPYEPFV